MADIVRLRNHNGTVVTCDEATAAKLGSEWQVVDGTEKATAKKAAAKKTAAPRKTAAAKKAAEPKPEADASGEGDDAEKSE